MIDRTMNSAQAHALVLLDMYAWVIVTFKHSVQSCDPENILQTVRHNLHCVNVISI